MATQSNNTDSEATTPALIVGYSPTCNLGIAQEGYPSFLRMISDKMHNHVPLVHQEQDSADFDPGGSMDLPRKRSINAIKREPRRVHV